MELKEAHRKLLGMRTYLNKFAIQVGYKVDQRIVQALADLIVEGYVIRIDTYYNEEVGCWLNVFQLTQEGLDLVARERIAGHTVH